MKTLILLLAMTGAAIAQQTAPFVDMTNIMNVVTLIGDCPATHPYKIPDRIPTPNGKSVPATTCLTKEAVEAIKALR